MPDAAPEPLSRFREDIAALIGAEVNGAVRFGVAVSGGPDSMALLWLAANCFPGRVLAATVDHGLRAEARGEAEMVARWCAGQDIAHSILTPPAPISGSVQSAARTARYTLLEDWREREAIGWLLTAHHADDQLETVLMRLNRASGVGGLAGIRARNGHILRPLLRWRREELATLADEQSLPHVHDPSNADLRFDRAALRVKLAGVDWLDPIAATQSAAACADAEEALAWVVSGLTERHVRRADDGRIVLDRHDFPREILRRLLLRMLAMAGPDEAPPRGESIEQAIIQLLSANKVSVGKWLISGGDEWTVCAAPPRLTR
ncbi:MAG: tRNA lysidine(34) synthetase TilS [Sphingobium sp.]